MHKDKKAAVYLWLIGFCFYLPALLLKLPMFFAVVGVLCILTGSWKLIKRLLIEHEESKVSGWDNPNKSALSKHVDDR